MLVSFHNRLLANGMFQRVDYQIVSHCSLCQDTYESVNYLFLTHESVNHLFFNYHYGRGLCNCYAMKFGLSLSFDGLVVEFFLRYMSVSLSFQFKMLWIATCIAILNTV